jgi:Domain of unknown function (DUF4279)
MSGGEHHRYKASLRVCSRTLTVADLSRVLGEPTKSHEAGEPVTQRHPDAPTRDQALWLRESGLDEATPLDQHITALLHYLDGHRQAFDAIRDQCEADIFCGIFARGAQGGFTLEPHITQRLATARLPVSFDIYSDE